MTGLPVDTQRLDPASVSGLQVSGLSHRFADGFEMRDISLQVAPGELVCLLGPSGCGKSTLLRLAAGLESVQSGSIVIGGRAVAGDGCSRPVSPEHRGVGLMFQDYALFPHLSVFDNVCFGLRGRDGGARRDWARRRLTDMGLADLSDRYPHTLSGGQQQRIALLRALAPEPGLMLLDEPFSGLDEHLRQQVRQETLSILKHTDTATLLVTHDPEEAMYLADRLVVMDHGLIVQDATPLQVYHHPVNGFVAGLFGPLNTFGAPISEQQVHTPLGAFRAQGLTEGSTVRVLVRASGVTIAPGVGVAARVRSARPLGQASQVLVGMGVDGSGPGVELRLPGIHLPAPDTLLQLAVDPREVFIFPG